MTLSSEKEKPTWTPVAVCGWSCMNHFHSEIPATEWPETKQNKTHFLKLKNLPTADTAPLLVMTYFDAFLLYFIFYRQTIFTVLK